MRDLYSIFCCQYIAAIESFHRAASIKLCNLIPVSARRRFNVDTTLFGRQQRCNNVKTTSRVHWDGH